MEDQCSPLSWAWYNQEDVSNISWNPILGIEELKHSLLYTTLELETTISCAHEELARKADELLQLKGLLTRTLQERDEAQLKCQRLALDKLILQQQFQHLQQQQQLVEDDPILGVDSNAGISSSGSDENVIETQGMDYIPQPPPLLTPPESNDTLALKKPLPENGKFLQAVMDAGPLLQTLLLAGPLPQWQHPPPQMNSIEIPLVTIPSSLTTSSPQLVHQDSCLSTIGGFSKKRGLEQSCEGLDFGHNTKNQKVTHQSSLTNNI